MREATQQLVKCNELEGAIARLKEEASTKEKEIREKTIRHEISKAIADFRTGEMAKGLR